MRDDVDKLHEAATMFYEAVDRLWDMQILKLMIQHGEANVKLMVIDARRIRKEIDDEVAES